MPAASASFVHISRVHQLTLNDECSKFQCLTNWILEHATRECDVALNLYRIPNSNCVKELLYCLIYQPENFTKFMDKLKRLMKLMLLICERLLAKGTITLSESG